MTRWDWVLLLTSAWLWVPLALLCGVCKVVVWMIIGLSYWTQWLACKVIQVPPYTHDEWMQRMVKVDF